jgi:putative methionine-R-sulfoxide reductase with GAF domain
MDTGSNHSLIARYLDKENGLGAVLQALRRFRHVVLFLTFLGPVLAGALEVLVNAGWLSAPSWALAQILFIVIGASAGLIVFLFDPSPDKLAAIATDAIRESMKVHQALEIVENENRELAALYSAVNVTWDAAVGVIESPESGENECEAFARMALDAMVEHKSTLLHFEDDEVWSAAIYFFNDPLKLLIPVAFRRSWRSEVEPRRWPRGEGHIGMAFDRERTLIHKDISGERAYDARGERVRSYDTERYRSIASVPIRNSRGRCLGVITSSSSTVGRFSEENTEILLELADAIACVFTMRDYRQLSTRAEGVSHA